MVEFKNKSSTLKYLEKILKCSIVLPQYSFTVNQYITDKQSVLNGLKNFCGTNSFIVRSSSLVEDSLETSKAGMFLSVPNVHYEDMPVAITEVINSFGKGSPEDIIFVQPMLTNVSISGVAFTIDPNNSGNYYVINYDESGSTDSVTSGVGNNLKTYYLFKTHKCSQTQLIPIIDSIKELESIYVNTPLDIEFAVSGGKVYILQTRPLVKKCYPGNYDNEINLIEVCKTKLTGLLSQKPNICGKNTILSVMTDWNPAEMIGIHPRKLALSLYKRLITDREWAYQRNNYGYRDLRSFPLMVDFHGFPYIDTRVSFNSFVPNDLDEVISNKLIDYYLECLRNSPEKHDKVEFDIIFSCYTFDLREKMNILNEKGFSKEEIEKIGQSLLKLTNNIIGINNGLWIQDRHKIDILESKRESILSSDLDDISKVYWLLEDCGRYGTLPFAGLARAGFIAVQLLKSLVSIGVLSELDYQSYMNNLNTVSSQMAKDRLTLKKSAFIKKYGHLRPGTYNITVERYDSNPDKYFTESCDYEENSSEIKPFSLTLTQYEKIDQLLKDHHFNISVLDLFNFIKNGIEGREYSKFVFTKNVSAVLELITKIGERYGLSREDLSYLDISVINELYCSAYDVESEFKNSITKGKLAYAETERLSFPPVIMNVNDIVEFFIPSCVPNYITTKVTSGVLLKDNFNKDSVPNKIILIEAADPGYDWIFSYPIKGFITKYGGANSHMAIRAGELGIPAVIGVGEKMFNEISNSTSVSIDCANHKVELLK